MKKFILFSLFFVATLWCVASERDTVSEKSPFWQNMQVEVRGDYGFFLHHHFEMTRYGRHLPTFEVALQKQTYGNDSWQSYYHYPIFGVGVFYSPLANDDVIGQAMAVWPFIVLPFSNNERNKIDLRFSGGLGFLTKKYDRLTNYTNTSIGSHVTAAFSITLEYRRLIAKRYTLGVHAGIVHFSNGSTRTPNNGLNLIVGGLSCSYLLQAEQETRIPRPEKIGHPYAGWRNDLFSYYLSFQMSAKDVDSYRGYGRNWAVYDVSFTAMKRISFLSKVGVGLTVVYDETDRQLLNDEGKKFKDLEVTKLGLCGAYEFMMGSTSVLINVGAHITGERRSDGILYEKVTLKQNLGKYMFGALSLTFHGGAADYIGYGVGVKIN